MIKIAQQKNQRNINIKITDNSNQVLAELDSKIQITLKTVGEKAVDFAQDDCPVRTSRLLNSITCATATFQSEANTQGGDADALPDDYKIKSKPEKGVVYIGTNVEYG